VLSVQGNPQQYPITVLNLYDPNSRAAASMQLQELVATISAGAFPDCPMKPDAFMMGGAFQEGIYFIMRERATNHILGFAWTVVMSEYIYIHWICTNHTQFSGVGITLMNAIANVAKQLKLARIELKTLPGAASFYEKLGFQRTRPNSPILRITVTGGMRQHAKRTRRTKHTKHTNRSLRSRRSGGYIS